MIDSRLGFTDLDKRLLDLMAPRLANGEVRLLALLTKSDKLNRTENMAAQVAAQEVLASVSTESADIGLCSFSALNKQGLGDVAEAVYSWTHRAEAPELPALPEPHEPDPAV
jgi:GTP-binding protein